MLEKCKNTMTYSYIECKSPLSQLNRTPIVGLE